VSEVAGKGAAGAAPPREGAASTQDALQLLRADHRRIDALLNDCARLAGERSSSRADRSGLLMRLGALLLAHAQIEKELFYPALEAAPMAIDDAHTDHDEIEAQFRRLNIGELPASDFGKGVATLTQLVREHVAEEEQQLFPHAQPLDSQELGTRMALRRAQLLGDQGED
jgi:iron-sulfur cluster repair protein YtfE (RIC family)